jgi:S1-C subfamily serine protease
VTSLEPPQKPKAAHISAVLLIIIIVVSLIAGGFIGYSIVSSQIGDLQIQVSTLQTELANVSRQISNLQNQVAGLRSSQNTGSQNVTYILGQNVSLSRLYEQVKNSVVVVEGVVPEYGIFGRIVGYGKVEGSGFIYDSTSKLVIITNYHVVESAVNLTVTFADGDGYAAKVIGSDPYADLAVLSANASQDEYCPIGIVSSLTLRVGDPVIAIGTPLGYTGSMTSGIVSALGRSVTVDWSSYVIADCIQTSAAINPGNSGGPLINYQGNVVGITSYGAIDPSTGQLAQGIGLAIPSSTILREVKSLVENHSYDQHPWLGTSFSSYFGLGTAATEGLPDLTYEIAKAMNANVTYGALIDSTVAGGPADAAGLRGGTQKTEILGYSITVGGDIIIAINGTRITGTDDLSTCLEEHTLPNQTVSVQIVRSGQIMTFQVKLGTRPPPS